MTLAYTVLYYGGLAGHVAAFACILGGAARASRAAAWIGVAFLWAWLGCQIWDQARLPIYGLAETTIYVSAVMGVLGIPLLWGGPGYKWLMGLSCLVLAMAPWKGLGPGQDFFMYNYPWSILFFNLRIDSLALLLLAAVHFAPSALGSDKGNNNGLTARGRKLLLFGSAAYLGGEFSGSYWAMNWLGDFWRWNRGFLQSAALFLLVMLGLHLPGRLAKHPRLGAWLGVLPGLAAAVAVFWHHWVESS